MYIAILIVVRPQFPEGIPSYSGIGLHAREETAKRISTIGIVPVKFADDKGFAHFCRGTRINIHHRYALGVVVIGEDIHIRQTVGIGIYAAPSIYDEMVLIDTFYIPRDALCPTCRQLYFITASPP